MTANQAIADQPVEAQRSRIDEENPWPGLGSFDEAAQRFFNGRDKEAAELRRLVLYAPLTVVFGGSGLGKTSLLQAGLFPLLRKENLLPVYVRLDVRDRRAPLIDQVKNAMLAQFQVQQVDAPAMGETESLWEWLHRDGLELWSQRNQLLSPLFVFDQFEEVFTLGAENGEAIARLRIDLADLIENRIPADLVSRIQASEAADSRLSLSSHRHKVLMSFREDFLPAVEGWKRDLPSIMRNRLRLLRMSGEQAFEAVHMTAPHLADETIARDIVRFVAAAQEERPSGSSNDAGSETELAVEPALLSLVCHGLNERRKAQGKSAFDSALLQGTGQAIISDYYQHAVGGLPERVQRFIEEELITERGFRKQCDVDDARSVHRVTDQELRLLVDRRLLRIEPHQRTERVELTHDLLTRVVRGHRDRQREREKGRKKQKRFGFLSLLGVAVLVTAMVLFGMYSNAQTAKALNEKQQAMKDVERRQQQMLEVIRLKQLELAKLQQSVAEGSATPLEVREVIASANRSLDKTRTDIEADRLSALVQQMNDTSADVRKAAGGRLAQYYRANPNAIKLVLDTLAAQKLGSLSPEGRINALYFLNRSDLSAWTGEHKKLAYDAIARIRAGGNAVGKQTDQALSEMERKLVPENKAAPSRVIGDEGPKSQAR